MERLEAKLADHERKLTAEQANLSRRKRALARRVREEQDSLLQYHRKVAHEGEEVQRLQTRIQTLHWAEQQRAALSAVHPPTSQQQGGTRTEGKVMNHDDIMPPPDAALVPSRSMELDTMDSNGLHAATGEQGEQKGDVPDQDIADAFTQSFESFSTSSSSEEDEPPTDLTPATTLVDIKRHSLLTEHDKKVDDELRNIDDIVEPKPDEDDEPYIPQYEPLMDSIYGGGGNETVTAAELTLLEQPTAAAEVTLMQLSKASAHALESKIRAKTAKAARTAAVKAAKLHLSPAATAKMVRDAANAESTHAANKYKANFAAVLLPSTTEVRMPPSVARKLREEKRVVAHATGVAVKAKKDAKKAKADKQRYLRALMQAHGKLAAFSKTVKDGNRLIGAKYEEKLKSEALKFQRQLQDEKAVTATKVRKQMEQEESVAQHRFQAHLQQLVAQKATILKAKAAAAVHAANLKAAKEKALAHKEAMNAKHAKAFSQKVAAAATQRSEALKAAAAAQLATMASQKAKAVGDFKHYTVKLKQITSEEKAKEAEKLLAGKHQVDLYQQEAAKAARIAETQTTELDLQKSHASISQVRAARAMLAQAIHEVSTVDTRARGRASIVAEHDALMAQAKKRKEEALADIRKAKEGVEKQHIRKAHMKAAERHAKAAAKEAIRVRKKAAEDKKIANVAYAKGKADADGVYERQLAAMHVKAVEKEAKALLQAQQPPSVASPTVPPPLSPKEDYAKLAKDLVDKAVHDTATGASGTKAAVQAAINGLKAHEASVGAAASTMDSTTSSTSTTKGLVDQAVEGVASGATTKHEATAAAIARVPK